VEPVADLIGDIDDALNALETQPSPEVPSCA